MERAVLARQAHGEFLPIPGEEVRQTVAVHVHPREAARAGVQIRGGSNVVESPFLGRSEKPIAGRRAREKVRLPDLGEIDGRQSGNLARQLAHRDVRGPLDARAHRHVGLGIANDVAGHANQHVAAAAEGTVHIGRRVEDLPAALGILERSAIGP